MMTYATKHQPGMASYPRLRRSIYLASLLALTLMAIVISGCSAVTPVPKTPNPTFVISPTLTPIIEQTVFPTAVGQALPITLTIWVPPVMAQSAESGQGYLYRVNQSLLTSFPLLRPIVVTKGLSGPGGMVNLLISTRPIDPSRLPDLVVIDAAELSTLEHAGVLKPLNPLFPQSLWDDTYPFALQAVRSGSNYMAVPFVTDIVLLVYNSQMVASPPRSWADLPASQSEYIFPAGNGNGSSADTLILQYLALGGKLQQDDGQTTFDPILATQVLRNYLAAVDAGIIPANIRGLSTFADCWELYFAGEVGMTNAPYSLYAQSRSQLTRSRYAAIPTLNGQTTTLAHSWVWVIVTDDPDRREAAARYIEAAIQPEQAASWAKAQSELPTRRSALALAVDDLAFRQFLDTLLTNAYPYPNLEAYPRIQQAIGTAIEGVFDGLMTPERAAMNAAAEISRLR
jgi:ABC-type glycerol-3-phosphate transport system substrate-binding protein